jgi:hypothetical protein
MSEEMGQGFSLVSKIATPTCVVLLFLTSLLWWCSQWRNGGREQLVVNDLIYALQHLSWRRDKLSTFSLITFLCSMRRIDLCVFLVSF